MYVYERMKSSVPTVYPEQTLSKAYQIIKEQNVSHINSDKFKIRNFIDIYKNRVYNEFIRNLKIYYFFILERNVSLCMEGYETAIIGD